MLIPEEKVRTYKTKESRESFAKSMVDFNKNKSFTRLNIKNKRPMQMPEISEKKYTSSPRKNSSFVARIRQKTANTR